MARTKKRSKLRRQTETDETWLIPYADILTLLLALFIVLFSMSSIDAQKFEKLSQSLGYAFTGGTGALEYTSPTQSIVSDTTSQDKDELKNESIIEQQELQKIQEKIEGYIDENQLHNRLTTSLSGEGLNITILDDALFDSGSAEVKSEARKLGIEISNFLVSDPPRSVVISGHTDNRPIHNADFASNWHLSVMRAVNFMQVMLENGQLNPSFLSAKGYGEFQPIASNDTAEDRSKNRRVEVLILPNVPLNLQE